MQQGITWTYDDNMASLGHRDMMTSSIWMTSFDQQKLYETTDKQGDMGAASV